MTAVRTGDRAVTPGGERAVTTMTPTTVAVVQLGVRTVATPSLVLACVVCTLTAALQSTVVAWRHFGLGQLTGFSRDFVWASLVAYLPFFLALWCVCWVLGRVFRPAARLRFHGTVYVTFGILCLGVLFPAVSFLAHVILALGLGVTLGNAGAWGVARSSSVRALWGGVAGFALFQVTAGLVMRNVLEKERRGPSTSTAAAVPSEGAPNVLLLILDTVRAISVGAYGNPRPVTPSIDKLAREGILFESAFSTAPWTLPSHASILTAKLPHELNFSFAAPLVPSSPMLPEVFRARGWATGSAVGNMYYTGWESGLGRGFEVFTDYLVTPKQILLHAQVLQTEWARGLVRAMRERSLNTLVKALVSFRFYNTERFPQFHRKWAPSVNEELLQWIGTLQGRPFFAFVNYFDAHIPYAPPTPERSIFDSTGRGRPLDMYEGAIRYLDAQIGQLIQDLEGRGILDNTILVITSDHGEQFGEHGLWEHGNSTYAPVTQVPLIIRLPGQEHAGRVVRTAVSVADLPATLTDLAGLGTSGFGGVSLAPIIRGDRASRGGGVIAEHTYDRHRPTEHNWRWRTIVDDSLAYVESGKWAPELFRLEDRKQVTNLIKRPEFSATVEAFRRQLDQLSPVKPPPP